VPRPSTAAGTAVAALALVLAPLSPAGAADRPDTISLVTGSSPEGISAGPGTTFFAGARADGAVYVGDVREGTVRQLVAGRAGEVAVGLLYDAATKRIWVAGGPTGDITAYDSRTGAQLFTVNTGTGRFLNDVAITRDAVYVTDSTKNQILVVPLGRGAGLPADGTAARVLTITGDYVQPTGFGLNGIRVLPGGDLLAVSGGVLYVIDPATGVADRVEVSGLPDGRTALSGGDGLELRGNTLYVVRGFNPTASVVVLRLGEGGRTATFVEEIADSDFNVPTTAALVAGDLLVVNGQFNDPATAPTEVVRIDRP
jgi:hypothetical protein